MRKDRKINEQHGGGVCTKPTYGDPTRTTSYSSTLIDLCFANTSSKIIKSGTIELSISDHVLVYMTHKVCYKQTGSQIVTIKET